MCCQIVEEMENEKEALNSDIKDLEQQLMSLKNNCIFFTHFYSHY